MFREATFSVEKFYPDTEGEEGKPHAFIERVSPAGQ